MVHWASPKMPRSVSGFACSMPRMGILQGMADVRASVPHLSPVAFTGDLKPVVLGEQSEGHVAFGLLQSGVGFLVVNVTEPFEEEQREDVGLEVSGIDGTAQDVGGFPEVGFEFIEFDQSKLTTTRE